MRLTPEYYEHAFSWDVSGQFLTDGLYFGGIKERNSLAVSLFTQCIKSTLYELDGPDGRLNRVLLTRIVNQHFTGLPPEKYIELWGGLRVQEYTGNALQFTRQEDNLNIYGGRLGSGDIFLVNRNYLYISEDGREKIENSIHSGDGFNPIIRFFYRVGIADTLVELT